MRLARLKPHIPTLQPKLGYAADDPKAYGRHRRATEHWQRWYHTRRWEHLRWDVLCRDYFTCAMCQHVIADTSQLICDHVQPHRGDARRFWAGPFQTLCKPCHDSAKQREEQRRS